MGTWIKAELFRHWTCWWEWGVDLDGFWWFKGSQNGVLGVMAPTKKGPATYCHYSHAWCHSDLSWSDKSHQALLRVCAVYMSSAYMYVAFALWNKEKLFIFLCDTMNRHSYCCAWPLPLEERPEAGLWGDGMEWADDQLWASCWTWSICAALCWYFVSCANLIIKTISWQVWGWLWVRIVPSFQPPACRSVTACETSHGALFLPFPK